MNKRNNTIRGVLLLVAAALMFSSCAETPGPEEEVTDTRTISFGTPALTRSAIDNAGDMQKEDGTQTRAARRAGQYSTISAFSGRLPIRAGATRTPATGIPASITASTPSIPQQTSWARA